MQSKIHIIVTTFIIFVNSESFPLIRFACSVKVTTAPVAMCFTSTVEKKNAVGGRLIRRFRAESSGAVKAHPAFGRGTSKYSSMENINAEGRWFVDRLGNMLIDGGS